MRIVQSCNSLRLLDELRLEALDGLTAAAYAGVLGTDFLDELNHEAFKGKTG